MNIKINTKTMIWKYILRKIHINTIEIYGMQKYKKWKYILNNESIYLGIMANKLN